jgi:hypothetical protein
VFSKDISPAVEPDAVTSTTVVGITEGVTLVTFLTTLTDIDPCLEYYVMDVTMGIKVGAVTRLAVAAR